MELIKKDSVILSDGHKYRGWGYYQNGEFIPHGCGKKFYDGEYAYGNFKNGILNGPAIVSYDYCMNTAIFKNDRGNGWGLCINSGSLIEFGYYKNSQLETDLRDFVEWYYEKMANSGRANENMLSMYTFNDSKEVAELLIGYSGTAPSNGVALVYMGFRFKSDGSVWVGNTATRALTGKLIHFTPSGEVIAGSFENGKLIERVPLQSMIDDYYGTWDFSDDDLFGALFSSRPKSSRQLRNEEIRNRFRGIDDIKAGFNYFTNTYNTDEDLPF